MKHIAISALIGASLLAGVPAHAQAPLYHLVDTVPLGGLVKFDYLKIDPARHWLYISHGSEETVLTLANLKIRGELSGLDGSHGIAVDPVGGLIWADSAQKGLAIAFDPRSFKPVAQVKVIDDADGMAYDAASKTIFVSGGDGKGLTPIDPATRKAGADIALGAAPESFVVDGHGALYVNLIDKNEIDRIDTATRKITATWPTTGCDEPTGLALDQAKRWLFASGRGGSLDVLNADTGAVIATLPIGKGTDSAAFDATRQRAFSSNGDGTLTVVDDRGSVPKVMATITTKPGARTLAVDPVTGNVYTVTGKVASVTPASGPDGHPHYSFVPGSLELLVYAPTR